MKKWFKDYYDWILIFLVTVSVLSTICVHWNELSVLSIGLKFSLLMIGLVAIINALTIRDKNVRISAQNVRIGVQNVRIKEQQDFIDIHVREWGKE